MVQSLSGQRELLRAAHDRLRGIAGRLGADDVLTEVAAAGRRLAETTFRLVVLGEYKRGKSTLINALLGKSVLPMGVVPLTSVVTELRYRAEAGIEIEFLDGRSQAIKPDDLPDYVTEPGNPRNVRQVRRAVVFEPSHLLQEGVTIVDTPGVGSVFQHNSEVTYQFLEESDAVVIVLAADQPLSSEELDLLKALAGITDRILFVVNRVDVLSVKDAEASLLFIRETLEALERRPPELVFPLSARLALEAGLDHGATPESFASFRHGLHDVLIGRKSDILIERAQTLTLGAMDLLALRLRSERRGMELESDQLEGVIRAFRLAAGGIQERLEQSGLLLKHQVERIHTLELQREAASARGRLIAELWPQIEATLGSRSARPLRGQVTELSAEIGRWVVEDLSRHYRVTEQLVHRGLSHALSEHMERVQAAVGEVVAQANRLLGMQTEVPRAVAPLSDRPRFYFRDWDYSGGHLLGHDWVLRLPRRWAEPRVRVRLRELLERRIDQNLAAIRYDWATRLDDAVRRFQASSRDQVTAIIGLINEALVRAELRGTGAELSLRMAALDLELETLATLRRNVEVAWSGTPSHVARARAEPDREQ